MKQIYSRIASFLKKEEGASAIEYALIAGLIAVVIITNVTGVGNSLNGTFAKVSGALTATPSNTGNTGNTGGNTGGNTTTTPPSGNP